MKEINISEIEGFNIGNAQNEKGGTGCTAVLCREGAVGGVDVRGGGPATRETALLSPLKSCEKVYGVMLAGGSAYGLDCASGAMRYLEERGTGFDVGIGKVPIVSCACIFDLAVGDFNCRADGDMGYAACVDSEKNLPKSGNFGAGTGATVGKFLGADRAMKGGLGFYAVEKGNLKIGAVVAVNCLGDVYDADTGTQIAGMLSRDGTRLDNTRLRMWDSVECERDLFAGNTTVGCIVTNAKLSKSQCSRLASVTHNGYAAAIKPVHTSVDGDTVFCLAHGDVEVNQDALGDLSTYVMAKAINNGVRSAKSAYGFKSIEEIIGD